jgi:hypothetical protein
MASVFCGSSLESEERNENEFSDSAYEREKAYWWAVACGS